MDFHEDFRRNEEAGAPSDRLFSLALAAGFAVMGLLPLVAGRPVRAWALGLSGVLAIVGLARPSILSPVRKLATRLVLALSAIISAVVATLLFYLVVTPIGFLMRRRQDLLGLRWDASAVSYWKRRDPPGPEPGSMPHQF